MGIPVQARDKRCLIIYIYMQDTTKQTKRYFNVDVGISYTVVATSALHAIQIVAENDGDFEECLLDYEGLGIKEIPAEKAPEILIWDDARDGGRFPLDTFELGAWASSEY